MEQSAVVEATPTVDVSVGPLVGITPEQRTEFRNTGKLPEVKKEEPKTEEAAPSSEPIEAKPAGDSEPPKQEKAERKSKGKTADERIAELEATIEKIKKGAGKETKAESSPAPATPEYTRPKPTIDDKDKDGKSKYATYEDYIEDLADWTGEQRDAKNKKEQREREQRDSFNAKVAEARTRYENFDSVKDEFVSAIGEPGIDPVVHVMLNESDVLPDLVFTIGSSKEDLEAFVNMAKTNPGKALRYIALTESLIADELAKPKQEASPEKPKTQAPKPPSEAGGRAAAPPDALDAAAKANDFRAFKAEATRRQLAKLKS